MSETTKRHKVKRKRTEKSTALPNDEDEVDCDQRTDSDIVNTSAKETDSSNHEEVQLRKELSNLPICDLLQLKEKMGEKLYNQALYGSNEQSPKPHRRVKKFKRENKNRPMEISSKVRVPKFRNVVAVKQRVVRDPRFDDLSGNFNETYFHQAYGFITDIKLREKQKLIQKLKKEKNEEKRKQMQELLIRMTQREKAERETEQKKQKERERKKKERQLVADGKKPYFLKKSEKRKIELAEQFQSLQKSGMVEKYMAKKKKKNLMKDKRKLFASSD